MSRFNKRAWIESTWMKGLSTLTTAARATAADTMASERFLVSASSAACTHIPYLGAHPALQCPVFERALVDKRGSAHSAEQLTAPPFQCP